MAIQINKILFAETEMLPDIVDTPLWAFINPEKVHISKKSDRQIARLYTAIRNRENYFQENTPTAFGNPQYSLLCGLVIGILQTMEAAEDVEDEKIIITKGKKILLVVDKLHKPKSYYEIQEENSELLHNLGL